MTNRSFHKLQHPSFIFSGATGQRLFRQEILLEETQETYMPFAMKIVGELASTGGMVTPSNILYFESSEDMRKFCESLSRKDRYGFGWYFVEKDDDEFKATKSFIADANLSGHFNEAVEKMKKHVPTVWKRFEESMPPEPQEDDIPWRELDINEL